MYCVDVRTSQHAGDNGVEVPGLLRDLARDVGRHHGELQWILLVPVYMYTYICTSICTYVRYITQPIPTQHQPMHLK